MELIELSARLDHGMPREPGIGFTLTSGRVFLGSLNEGGHRLFHGGQGRTRNRKDSLFISTQFFNFFPSLGDLSSGALSNHAIGLERGGRQGWDIEEHEKSLGRLHD